MRQWSSLRLDVELSQVEKGLLERHLAGCPSCAAFDADVRAVAHAVRAAPPETPARRWELRPAAGAPGRRRRALVALVAAALLLGVLFGSLRTEGEPPPAEPQLEIGLLTDDPAQLRELPRRQKRQEPRPRDEHEFPRFPAVRT